MNSNKIFISRFIIGIYERGIYKLPKDNESLQEFSSILDKVINEMKELNKKYVMSTSLLILKQSFNDDYKYLISSIKSTIKSDWFYGCTEDDDYIYLNIENNVIEELKQPRYTHMCGFYNFYIDEISNCFVNIIKEESSLKDIYDDKNKHSNKSLKKQ